MLTLTLVASLLGATPAPKVAALDWNVVNLTPELAAFYADALAQALRKEGLSVVTSQDVAALLGMERQKQLLGCDDDSNACLAELGSALGCDLVLAASVAKLDDAYRGTLKLLSARDGTVKSETSLEAGSQKALLDALEGAARRLAEPLVPRAPVAPLRLRSKAWIPAAAGGVLVAGAVAGFAVAGGNHATIATAPTRELADGYASAGRTAQGVGWAAAGLGVAALGTAAVFFFAGADQPALTPSVSVTPAGAMVGVCGVWP